VSTTGDSLEGAGGTGAPAPVTPALDQNDELQRLRSQNEEYSRVLGALDPYADTIKRIVEDEDFRGYVGESTKYYDDLRQRKPADTNPELARLRDEIVEQIKPMRELVDGYQRQQNEAIEARKTRTFNEGKQILEPFLAEHPELRSNRAFAITLNQLQADAVERDRPFKEVWDEYASGFAPAPASRRAPPASLRANDGDQGIPAAAARRPASAPGGKPPSIAAAFMETHRRVNGKAS
jgi:hypothetical protein